ncbi:leucine-rich repeat-containing protein 63 [Gracilinanus agilis]|uniref:leucine-rich repeat-containing protein 63 n=1 Tax=Gracilinanus agilis TaxID=191870 RepID=UPI001CFEFD6C|nr:leucine-rich repeat-containing protein 63 [Gracilinanus agilis]
MLTQSKLLRRPLPPMLRPKVICPKPPNPKKEKTELAITNEDFKQQDLPKISFSKIIPTEMEKKIIPRIFFKRRRQSKLHVKNLLFKWKIKGDLDTTSKKQAHIYLLFTKAKGSRGSPIYMPTCSWGKEESISEKSCKIKTLLLDNISESSKTVSSRSVTPLSSRSGPLSSYRKTNKEGLTTPDSSYVPFPSPLMIMPEDKKEAKKPMWISKVRPSNEIINNQLFSFDKLPASKEKTSTTTDKIASLKTKKLKKRPESKVAALSETSDLAPDFLSKFEEECDEEPLAIYGEGYFSRDAIDINNPKLNLARIAVLRCHQYERNALNFKGFFIDECPKLNILAHLLVYINLSFNNFTEFPREVLIVEHLQVLIMRNNPIKEICPDIKELHHLKIFIISFNLLTSLPNELFLLYELEFLDVSYNEITFIPNEIESLSALNTLNVDGNELYYLPPGILKLQLETFIVENNFIHPVLWKESCKNDVQTLTDMALLTFSFHQLEKVYKELPPGITEQLVSSKVCECCKGPMYGKGLRVIQPVDIFNVPLVPILYCVCSVKCYNSIKHSSSTTDPNASE